MPASRSTSRGRSTGSNSAIPSRHAAPIIAPGPNPTPGPAAVPAPLPAADHCDANGLVPSGRRCPAPPIPMNGPQNHEYCDKSTHRRTGRNHRGGRACHARGAVRMLLHRLLGRRPGDLGLRWSRAGAAPQRQQPPLTAVRAQGVPSRSRSSSVAVGRPCDLPRPGPVRLSTATGGGTR
jgi:hypothetical protein